MEEIAKDGSKLLVVQALQRAAKNFEEDGTESVSDQERAPDANNDHVKLGIFGDFWLQKPFSGTPDAEASRKSTRPTPIFRKEEYYDKFPELLVHR